MLVKYGEFSLFPFPARTNAQTPSSFSLQGDGPIATQMVNARPPVTLVIRRSMTRLLRESRKIENIYTVVTASEEAPGEIVVQAYVPSQGITHRITVSDEIIQKLGHDATGAEKDALLSGDGRRIARPVVDRLLFRKGRGDSKQIKLIIRAKGGAGRRLFSEGRKVTGIFHIVSCFESAGSLRITTYSPSTSTYTHITLTPRERIELLGSLSWGEQPRWTNEIFKRLNLKGGRSKKLTERKITFDRSVHRHGCKVGKIRVLVTFVLPGAKGGLKMRIYHASAGREFIIDLDDMEVQETLRTLRRMQLIEQRLAEDAETMRKNTEEAAKRTIQTPLTSSNPPSRGTVAHAKEDELDSPSDKWIS